MPKRLLSADDSDSLRNLLADYAHFLTHAQACLDDKSHVYAMLAARLALVRDWRQRLYLKPSER